MLTEKSQPPIEYVKNPEEYAEIMTKCLKSCAYFVEQFIGFDVYDYNKAFLDCEDRFIVYRTGRQVGKSTNVALKAIHFGYFASVKAQNIGEGVANVVIASLSRDQANLIFEKITNFVHKSPTLTKAITRETRTELALRWFDDSGVTKFIVRPIGDTGESLRGFTSHLVILDEAAYVPEAVYIAFMPSAMTTRAKILLTSTPVRKAGMFFKACEESHVLYERGKPKELLDHEGRPKTRDKYVWTQFHVSSLDNPSTASDPAFLKMIESLSEEAKRRDIYGEFTEGGNSIIAFNLLQESLRRPKENPKFDHYDLGVDTSGKGKDETVLTTYGITPDDTAYAVDVYTEETTDQVQLAYKIDELDRTYHYSGIYMDSTGIGDALIDICTKHNSTLPLYPVNFKQQKTELYVNLAQLFIERRINLSLLREGDKEKLAEQLSYMYWYHGEYKDQTPKARSDYSDDYSDSSALGTFGLQTKEYIQDIGNDFWA